jgi:hypothetical protein
MKIRLVGAPESLHADGETDMTKLTVAFSLRTRLQREAELHPCIHIRMYVNNTYTTVRANKPESCMRMSVCKQYIYR